MEEFRVGIVGGAGRMGQELYQVLKSEPVFNPAIAIDQNQSDLFAKQVKALEELNADQVDGLIDFSLPELTEGTLNWVIKNKRPTVIGTTGLSDKHFQLLKEAGKVAPVLWAPNMSIGVALLAEAMKILAKAEGFDFHITEFHHRHKKDNPSGTAVYLREQLESALGDKKIPEPTGVRGGGIYGVHQVFAMSDEEVLCFEHQALNRRVFAKGAVRALSWLKNQKAGNYSLSDILTGR